MRQLPAVAPNKFTLHGRVAEVEVVASNALTSAKEAHDRIDRAAVKGEKGDAGPKGERGATGDVGRDGINGTSGRDAVGIQGPPGQRGKDCECKLELAQQHIARLESNLADSRDALAAVRKEFADLKLVVAAIYDQNKQAAGYVEYLRAKTKGKQ